MNLKHASRDPGRYAVDRGRRIDRIGSTDETEFGAQEVEAGIRRAEDERRREASGVPSGQQENLPSEIFFG
jgi:hypothetical protein